MNISLITMTMAAVLYFTPDTDIKKPEKTLAKAPTGWEKYTSPDGNASINMPAAFQVSEEENEQATTTKVTCTLGDKNFFLGITEHKNPMTAHEEMARVSLDAFVEQLQGEILSEGPYKYKKYPGLQAKIKIGDKGFCMYKVALIKQHQYQLVVVSPKDDFDKTEKKFFKSFMVKE